MMAVVYYLLKVVLCSGILFLYYHLALRNKLFHQWNRSYLLLSVVISIVAPVVQVSIMNTVAEKSNKAIKILQVFQSADGYLEDVTIRGRHGVSTDQWLLMGYLVISLILFIALLLSLNKVSEIIRTHTVQWIERIRFINSNTEGTPFSFFNFIFWNDQIDLQTETGQQIFRHELVHIRERHTLDKLMIQVVLIFCWPNPFFWLIKRELHLVHEFIADKKAVGDHGAAALAAMILNTAYPKRFNSITNQFFQTSIKRRLAMLTRNQKLKISYFSRVLALPVVAVTVFAFTLRTKPVSAPMIKLETPFTVVIDAGHGITGGKPSGVTIADVSEDQIVLSIANKIKELNADPNLRVVLTRTTENIVELHKRVEFAKENNANLFISLHVDAKVPQTDPGLSSEQSLNSGFGVFVSNKQTAFQAQSELLGSIARQELNAAYPTNPYLLKRKVGIWVLDQNICPSILVECGFLTDQKDRAFISSDKNQALIAQKLLDAVKLYASNQQMVPQNTMDTVPQKQQQVKEVVITNSIPGSTGDAKGKGSKTNSANSALIIVDGKTMTKAEMDAIDPNSIESINVLKDDAARKKYGKKGDNGVIEVSLKTGKSIKEVTLQPKSIDTVPKKQPVFSKVETEPSIDRAQWTAFLRKNLQPIIDQAAVKGIKPGTYVVKLKFIVNLDGTITDIKALNDPGYDLASTTVAFVKDSPRWMPATQNGKAVNAYHVQPVTFVIQDQ
jgi:N-acetylmuramoyl-L-alanine amidase